MRTNRFTLLLLYLLASPLFGQNVDYSGTYTDAYIFKQNDSVFEAKHSMSRLVLNKDGNFSLKTHDPVFSYTFNDYQTTGKWIAIDKEVILNPDKLPRESKIVLHEKIIGTNDSVTIKINYLTETYHDEALIETVPFDFDMMTIALNNPKNYFNLVRQKKGRHCGFARKIRKQKIIDSTNSFKVSRQDIQKIGIVTYGFEEMKWLEVTDPNSDYFEITVVQPLDTDRKPRSQKVIMRKRKAHFYLRKNGKIDHFAQPLMKVPEPYYPQTSTLKFTWQK